MLISGSIVTKPDELIQVKLSSTNFQHVLYYFFFHLHLEVTALLLHQWLLIFKWAVESLFLLPNKIIIHAVSQRGSTENIVYIYIYALLNPSCFSPISFSIWFDRSSKTLANNILWSIFKLHVERHFININLKTMGRYAYLWKFIMLISSFTSIQEKGVKYNQRGWDFTVVFFQHYRSNNLELLFKYIL